MRNKKMLYCMMLVLVLVAEISFAETNLIADIGTWSHYVQNNVYHGGFYGHALAATDNTNYNKASVNLSITYYRNGLGIITQGTGLIEDTTLPLFVERYYYAPGYESGENGCYTIAITVTASLFRPGFSPLSDTKIKQYPEIPQVCICCTRVED